MRKNSIKNSRINGEVQRVLSSVLQNEIKDPRISPLCTITDVIVAPDLKTAKVFFSVMGDDDEIESSKKGLSSCAGFIRKRLAESLNMRHTPELTFVYDNSIAYGVRMTHLIDDMSLNGADKNV